MTNHYSTTRLGNSLRTAQRPWRRLELLVAAAGLALTATPALGFDARGGQFIGFKSFSAFEQTAGARRGEVVLTSPQILARIDWDELIASWNAETPDGAYLKIEARAIYPAGPTKYYTMGLWSSNPARYPRESVLNQADADGNVETDTLILRRPCDRLQLRLTLGGDHS